MDAISLIALLVVGYFSLAVIRRSFRLLRKPDNRPVNYDFSIGDLHDMHRRGLISPEELERAKAGVLKRTTERLAMESQPKGHGFEVIQKPPADETSQDKQ